FSKSLSIRLWSVVKKSYSILFMVRARLLYSCLLSTFHFIIHYNRRLRPSRRADDLLNHQPFSLSLEYPFVVGFDVHFITTPGEDNFGVDIQRVPCGRPSRCLHTRSIVIHDGV